MRPGVTPKVSPNLIGKLDISALFGNVLTDHCEVVTHESAGRLARPIEHIRHVQKCEALMPFS